MTKLPVQYMNRYLVVELLLLLFAAQYYFVAYPRDLKKAVHTFMFLQLIINPAFMFISMLYKKMTKEMKILFAVLSISLVYTYFVSVAAFQINPNASRLVTGSLDEESVNYEEAIGYYDMGVANLSLSLSFLYLLSVYLRSYIDEKYKLCKYIYAVVFMALAYYLYSAQYGTLFALGICTLFFVGWYYIPHSYKFVYVILCALCYLLLPPLLNIVANSLDGSTLSIRIHDMALIMKGDMSGESTEGRSSVYMPAIISFLKSPIWGNTMISNGTIHLIDDSHSIILGALVTSGLFGAFIILRVFFIVVKMINEILPFSAYFKVPIILFACICFLDSSIYAVTQYAIIFLYTPLTIYILKLNEK